MKVKATGNIKVQGGWYRPGEVFEAEPGDIAGAEGLVEVLETEPAPEKKPARKKTEK